MATSYSSLDTIDNYEFLFKEFKIKFDKYADFEKRKRLIYFSAGLGLSNSFHEKFIKSIIEEYKMFHSLSNSKKKDIIWNHKAPGTTKRFVDLLELDLDESFNLYKEDIQSKFSHIDSFDSVIAVISEQRDIRNNYMHGDFDFLDEIEAETFKDNIIDFQIIHHFIIKLIRYSFYKNKDKLPDIGTKI